MKAASGHYTLLISVARVNAPQLGGRLFVRDIQVYRCTWVAARLRLQRAYKSAGE